MTGDSSRLAEAKRDGDVCCVGGIAGLIEGSMTMLAEPGGGASFRVLIGTSGGRPADRDLLELVVSAEHIADIGHALAACGAVAAAEFTTAPSVPCRIGFRRKAVSAAA